MEESSLKVLRTGKSNKMYLKSELLIYHLNIDDDPEVWIKTWKKLSVN